MKRFSRAVTARISISALLSVLFLSNLHAYEMTGLHAFQNDDRNQFADFWLNTDGNVSIKVSNGRPWRPMWIVLHARFMSGNQLLAQKDYHVYCQSPFPGGHGAETLFTFSGPGVTGVTNILLSSNKQAPWKNVQGGWEIMISASRPAP